MFVLAFSNAAHGTPDQYVSNCGVVSLDLSELVWDAFESALQSMDAGTFISPMGVTVASSTQGSLKISGQACGSNVTCGNQPVSILVTS